MGFSPQSLIWPWISIMDHRSIDPGIIPVYHMNRRAEAWSRHHLTFSAHPTSPGTGYNAE